MNNEIVKSLIQQVTEEVLSENQAALEQNESSQASIQLAVQLSAVTTLKILEKLELIDKD
ncbi:hypothetical protein [Paenibacillus piscarius]|uniref:hypothetical protein n=1 Tax=Paenibacillus piscarius TaxID=1089681 RepID=UPI001EE7E9F1|nr:hypothetical protein [Paenibacillus piscarius]